MLNLNISMCHQIIHRKFNILPTDRIRNKDGDDFVFKNYSFRNYEHNMNKTESYVLKAFFYFNII